MLEKITVLFPKLFELKCENDVHELIEIGKKINYYKCFFEYFNAKVAEKSLKVSRVIRDSCVNSNYVYSILNGRRLNPGRDKVIALCMGAHFDLGEIMCALEISDNRIICPVDVRDVWIAFAVNQKEYSILKLNLRLEEEGLEPLDL